MHFPAPCCPACVAAAAAAAPRGPSKYDPLAALLSADWQPPTRVAAGGVGRYDAFGAVLEGLLAVEPAGARGQRWAPLAWLLDGWAGEWGEGSAPKYDPATGLHAAALALAPSRASGADSKYDPLPQLLGGEWADRMTLGSPADLRFEPVGQASATLLGGGGSSNGAAAAAAGGSGAGEAATTTPGSNGNGHMPLHHLPPGQQQREGTAGEWAEGALPLQASA